MIVIIMMTALYIHDDVDNACIAHSSIYTMQQILLRTDKAILGVGLNKPVSTDMIKPKPSLNCWLEIFTLNIFFDPLNQHQSCCTAILRFTK